VLLISAEKIPFDRLCFRVKIPKTIPAKISLRLRYLAVDLCLIKRDNSHRSDSVLKSNFFIDLIFNFFFQGGQAPACLVEQFLNKLLPNFF
jgi:hypothetical protein